MEPPKNLGVIAVMENVVSPDYQAHMAQTAEQGRCPLCGIGGIHNKDGEGFDPKKNIVILETEHCRCWASPFKYEELETQIILAPKKHIVRIEELGTDTPEGREYWAMVTQMAAQVQAAGKGGGIVTRFGNPGYSACTVIHLHTQINIPDLNVDDYSIAIFRKNPELNEFLEIRNARRRKQKAAVA